MSTYWVRPAGSYFVTSVKIVGVDARLVIDNRNAGPRVFPGMLAKEAETESLSAVIRDVGPTARILK